MARLVKVIGAAVVLKTIDKRESYFYRGAVVPAEGFTEEGLEHVEAAGLIELIDEAEVVEVTVPKVTDSHDEIDAFAAEFSIDLAGLGDKPNREQKVAEIERVIAERTAAAEATGVLQ